MLRVSLKTRVACNNRFFMSPLPGNEPGNQLTDVVFNQIPETARLPARFTNTRNQPLVGQVPETNSANAKFAIDRSWSTTHLAASFATHRIFRFSIRLGDF
jgi:hypothetical protein